ncbi:hypothetical protein ACIU1J_06360 [Azospirillum doebereinerae]|uniref:CRISPR-associated protein Cas4 n=1 Tax=Azospirillum doebereinerae TaxID=92933 RepID=UPI00384D01CC
MALDATLRALTERTAQAVREMIRDGVTPPPVHEARKCQGCSMLDLCRPKRLSRPPSVSVWLARQLDDAAADAAADGGPANPQEEP